MFTPQFPDYKVPWRDIDFAFQWIRDMKACPQDPEHHAEGNVWIHTRMVCEEMAADPEWRALAGHGHPGLISFWAALLHDVAKPVVTKRELDGRLHANNHAKVGARMARKILWELQVPWGIREAVCGLVRHHLKPMFALDSKFSKKIAIECAMTSPLHLLRLLAKADMKGRISEHKQDALDNIELFHEYACEVGLPNYIHDIFPNDHSRFLFFRDQNATDFYAAHFDPKCWVTLMSGLPGSGKDTWLAAHYDGPVISLDGIRKELKAPHTGNQGKVIAEAKKRAKEFLRQGQDFAWNATNLSKQMRSEVISLFAAYNAAVRIVYVEALPNVLYERNQTRQDPLPENALEKLMRRWEVPDLTEAHEVEYVEGVLHEQRRNGQEGG